jgi:outer membrane protein assembly factor BamA
MVLVPGQFHFNSNSFVVNEYATKTGDSAFPIKYTYIRFFEKAYRKIGAHLYAGGGLGFDIYSSLNDLKQTDTSTTPHHRYSLRNGFDPNKYSANGFLLALQYNNRDHPLRSYGGMYADLSFRVNQKWLGSTKNSIQLQYDFRKYWSLSKRNPAHVLAIWNWASFKLSGDLPYLFLPSTGSDTYARSGRGYTIGYFKGPHFEYIEAEYRFPITRNKFLSGVCFINSPDGLR